MNTGRLNLYVKNPELVERAKLRAEESGTTLSAMFGQFLQDMENGKVSIQPVEDGNEEVVPNHELLRPLRKLLDKRLAERIRLIRRPDGSWENYVSPWGGDDFFSVDAEFEGEHQIDAVFKELARLNHSANQNSGHVWISGRHEISRELKRGFFLNFHREKNFVNFSVHGSLDLLRGFELPKLTDGASDVLFQEVVKQGMNVLLLGEGLRAEQRMEVINNLFLERFPGDVSRMGRLYGPDEMGRAIDFDWPMNFDENIIKSFCQSSRHLMTWPSMEKPWIWVPNLTKYSLAFNKSLTIGLPVYTTEQAMEWLSSSYRKPEYMQFWEIHRLFKV